MPAEAEAAYIAASRSSFHGRGPPATGFPTRPGAYSHLSFGVVYLWIQDGTFPYWRGLASLPMQLSVDSQRP